MSFTCKVGECTYLRTVAWFTIFGLWFFVNMNALGINLRQALRKRQMTVLRSPGDGHCLLYSVVSAWNAQSSRVKIDLETVKTKLVKEVIDHSPVHSEFITDSSIEDALDTYVFAERYNQVFGDAMPFIIANTLEVNFEIYYESVTKYTYERITVLTERAETERTIVIHRCGDHYNGIVSSSHRSPDELVSSHTDTPSSGASHLPGRLVSSQAAPSSSWNDNLLGRLVSSQAALPSSWNDHLPGGLVSSQAAPPSSGTGYLSCVSHPVTEISRK